MNSGPEPPLYDKAVRAIQSTNLSALGHMMFVAFLMNAVSRDEAAQYIIDCVSQVSPDDALRSVKTELTLLADKFSRDDPPIDPGVEAALPERDSNRCCVSGQENDFLKPTYIVSPSIKDNRDLLPGGRLRGLLETAITKELADQLFSYLECSGHEDMLENLWLMSPSVRDDFKNGHIFMERDESVTDSWWIVKQFLEESGVPELHGRFHKQPATPDQRRLPLPGAVLIANSSSHSIPLHFIPIEGKISRGWPPVEKKGLEIGRFGRLLIRGIFRLTPKSVHPSLHRLILKAVNLWKPQPAKPFSTLFKSLPFGLCLKIGARVSENEANALRLVEKYTTVKAPLLINFTRNEGTGYLLMTKVPGAPLDIVFWRMTYEERRQLARDLGDCISQLRCIPNKNNHIVCDTTGGPLTDHRLEPMESWGPYNSKPEFLDDLTAGLENRRGQPPLSYLYAKYHAVCLTHSDLSLPNLFVGHGRLSGIIDWEHAGFKPEYWEYRKLASDYALAYIKDYQEELEGERMLWRLKPVFRLALLVIVSLPTAT